jgi:hypothetical protein
MRRILLLNVALVVLLAIGAVRLKNDWQHFDATHQPSSIRPRSETLPGLPTGSAPAATGSDWTAIPSRNPFSFDRTDITLTAPPEPTAPPKPVGPKPVLFGVMTIGASRVALVSSGQGGGNNRNSRPLKVGDTIDGWNVVGINDTSMLVEGNSIRETLIINDPSSQVPRDHTRTLSGNDAVTVNRTTTTQATPAQLPPPVTPPSTGGAPLQPGPGGQVLPDGSRVIQTPFGPHVIPKDPPQR